MTLNNISRLHDLGVNISFASGGTTLYGIQGSFECNEWKINGKCCSRRCWEQHKIRGLGGAPSSPLSRRPQSSVKVLSGHWLLIWGADMPKQYTKPEGTNFCLGVKLEREKLWHDFGSWDLLGSAKERTLDWLNSRPERATIGVISATQGWLFNQALLANGTILIQENFVKTSRSSSADWGKVANKTEALSSCD